MKIKRVAFLGLTIALAMIMSYIETLFPLNFAVPGIKMGLANIVIIFVLYRMSFGDACIVSLVRVFLVSLLFGNVMALAYSLAGASLSLLVMYLLKKSDKFSVIGVSITGAVMHNVGQIVMAMIILHTSQLAYYMAVLMLSGILFGALTGVSATLVMKHMKHIKWVK